ncbi:type II toxin-antitoxin system RatA family toxin [Streptomyces sp. NBC_01089]|uniref:type II toxin-antitoxin system RatA family toxin n=1 Tax=Streptomyces sp. NBC_01089 TaxID=2903747 RepID=UPI003870D387|nr:SRPBCC family protein [Streptomyces sp. NBC_01089]
MPDVTVSRVLPDHSADEVWNLVKDSREIGSRARSVLHVHSVSHAEKLFRITDWKVLLNGSAVSWRQREAAGPGHSLRFEQTEGDLESLSGVWQVRALGPDTTELTLTISFELGVDGLAPLLDPIWSQSFRAHADELVRSVDRLAL